MQQKSKRSTTPLLGILLCAASLALHAAGPRSFGQSNQQTGSLKVSRFDYDASDRAKQAGIAFDTNENNKHAANGTTYTFDAANRLIKSVSVDAVPVIVEYFYDALGQLVRTKTNGVSSDYVLDESGGLPRVIGEITGTTEQLYVYGPEGLHAQRKIENGVAQPVQYALNDGLGSVKGMVDSSGAIIGAQAYNSWGEIRYRGGAQPPSLGYTGEQNIADGTVHLRARSYLPSQGRFLQRDSFAGFADNAQSQNRYAYAEGNPVNATDPSGHIALVSSKGVGADIDRGMTLLGRNALDPTAVASNLQNESIVTAITIAVAGGLSSGQYGQGLGMGLGLSGNRIGQTRVGKAAPSALPNLPGPDGDNAANRAHRIAPGQTIAIAGETAADTQIIRINRNVISFDTATNRKGVEIASEIYRRNNPSCKGFVFGTGTHGWYDGSWGTLSQADVRITRFMQKTFGKPNLFYDVSPIRNPTGVNLWSDPPTAKIGQGPGPFLKIEERLINKPGSNIGVVRGWCYSSASCYPLAVPPPLPPR